MTARDVVLNIAVNLGRIARWASENKKARIPLFLDETTDYFRLLEDLPKSKNFLPTFNFFKKEFFRLKASPIDNNFWADDMFTWANILTHRAKLT